MDDVEAPRHGWISPRRTILVGVSGASKYREEKKDGHHVGIGRKNKNERPAASHSINLKVVL
jgi:hypothetical protein